MKRGIIYTNKKQSTFGIMSTVFGVMSAVTYIVCIYKSYLTAGFGVERYASSAILATLFMLVGFGLGIYSLQETDRFLLFRITGMVCNVVALLCLSSILYAGALIA